MTRARVVPPEMHIFDCAVENRARDDFRDLWDCGTEIKNAEVGHFVESRRSDASEAPFRVRGRVTPRTIEGWFDPRQEPPFSLKGVVRRAIRSQIVRRAIRSQIVRRAIRSQIVRRAIRSQIVRRAIQAIVYFEHRIAKVTPQVKRTLFEETTDPS
ncbi:hypothetical protein MTP99_014330 [Tenebrio molitor]|nr:hypothetical protein MTP99_014330 [Tenebrio molitor]